MAEMKSITLNGKKYEIPEGSSALPPYTESDYGKFLSPSEAGLVWVELADAEANAF